MFFKEKKERNDLLLFCVSSAMTEKLLVTKLGSYETFNFKSLHFIDSIRSIICFSRIDIILEYLYKFYHNSFNILKKLKKVSNVLRIRN